MSDQNFQQRLRDSDVRYFQAAALNKNMLGGQLSFMPGLSSQAGPCVFHSLEKLLERGDAVIYNALVPHQSGSNTSKNSRVAQDLTLRGH